MTISSELGGITQATAQKYLAGSIAAMMCAVALWEVISRFNLDAGAFLLGLGVLPVPASIYVFYTRVRRDPRIASVAFAVCFMFAFAPCCSILTYFALGHGLTRVDQAMANMDKMMGFDWVAFATFAANHQTLNYILFLVYRLSVWQVLVVVAVLGLESTPSPEDMERFLIAFAASALLSVAIWWLIPTIGATAVYALPANIEANLHADVSAEYTRQVIAQYATGPKLITPLEVRGLVGFPSFHTAEAIISTWYVRRLRWALWAFLPFNILVIFSCPTQGGHDFVDLLGGAVVAAIVIGAVEQIRFAGKAAERQASSFVPSTEIAL